MAVAPLQIRARCVADFPTIREQVEYAVSLGHEIFVPTEASHGLEAVLCGSGPSIRDQLPSIRKKAKDPKCRIFGIKGAHDFLVKHKISPDFAVAVDPLEKIHKENFLLPPIGKTVYFIASQCHPTLFDALKDRHVVVWHLLTRNLMLWAQEEGSPVEGHFMVPGGSTSGLRAMVLAFHMGFRKLHLYGFDSCLSGKLRKITGETRDPTDKNDVLELTVAGKTFYADKAMASQANEFQSVLDGFKGELSVKGYGKGMIQTIIKERYKQGAKGCLL